MSSLLGYSILYKEDNLTEFNHQKNATPMLEIPQDAGPLLRHPYSKQKIVIHSKSTFFCKCSELVRKRHDSDSHFGFKFNL